MLFRTSLARTVAFAAGFLACIHGAGAATIIADTFSRTGNIVGTQTEIGGLTYSTAGTDSFTTNGSRLNISGLHWTATVPFNVPLGVIVKASVDLQVPTSNGMNWLSFGFRSNTTGSAFNDSSPWVYVRGNGQVEARASISPDMPEIFSHGVAGVAGAWTHIDWYLDTRQTQWQASLYLDGTFNGTYAYATNPTISYIAMGHDWASGSFDNLKVEIVPEPNVLHLCLVGMAAIRWRRSRA